MTPADRYNLGRLAQGAVGIGHVSQLVAHYQAQRGLDADGMLGPATLLSLRALSGATDGMIVVDGWLQGPDVLHTPAHASWHRGAMVPTGIVAHYTATAPGTAEAMARRRQKRRMPLSRPAIWHVTIAVDGKAWQQLPFGIRGAHCKNAKDARIRVRDQNGNIAAPNSCTLGIELEGFGNTFPLAQVRTARAVWRAIVQGFGIDRGQAMLAHADLDPGRRSDPGPVWLGEHAPGVLAYAFE
jgi:hypothetical protein